MNDSGADQHMSKETTPLVGANSYQMGMGNSLKRYRVLDGWGCLLRYISDRIAPVIGPPRPPPRLAATG